MESPRSVGLINVITLIKNDCTKMRSGSKGTFNLVLSVTGSKINSPLPEKIIRIGLHSGLHRQHQLWMESFRFRPQHNHRVLRQETKLSQCFSPLRDAHEYQQPLRETWRSNRCGGEGGGGRREGGGGGKGEAAVNCDGQASWTRGTTILRVTSCHRTQNWLL